MIWFANFGLLDIFWTCLYSIIAKIIIFQFDQIVICPSFLLSGHDFKGCDDVDGSGELQCSDTPHGCCPDGILPAEGPRFQGCRVHIIDPITPDCMLSNYGCCPDGSTAAQGWRYEGCPSTAVETCKTSTYGCCSDGTTSAQGWRYKGCPSTAVETCGTGTYGCCSDGKTVAQGPNEEGCPSAVSGRH